MNSFGQIERASRLLIWALAGASILLFAPRGQAQPNKVRQRIPALIVTLHPSGFEPSVVAISERRFFLVVQNATGTSNLNLRLSRQLGPQLKDAAVRGADPQLREVLDLPPGTYELQELGNPKWKLTFTIK